MKWLELMTNRPQNQSKPLEGGHMSQPVRRGKELWKPPGMWTRASFDLLTFLKKKHFSAAPRALRVSPQGDAVLSFMEGDVASGAPLPDYVWSIDSLTAVTKLLLQLHDLTEGWRPNATDWRRIPGAPEAAAVMCHNDPGPWNTLFRDRRPVALIDWDSAAPGTRLWDMGYLAWHWVPLWPDDRAREHGFVDLTTRPQRLAAIAGAYGHGTTSAQLLEAAADRQRAWRRELLEGADAGVEAYRKLLAAGSEAGVAADLAFTTANRDVLLAPS